MYIPTQLRYNLRLLDERPKNLAAQLAFAECESLDPAITNPVVQVGDRCVILQDAWLIIETKPDSEQASLVNVDVTSIVETYREG